MTLKDRIAYYLASGLKPADVAEITGASAGYVSQLLKDEAFKDSVQNKMVDEPVPEQDALTAKYSSLEHRIVNEMHSAVVGAELPHLTRALEAVARSTDMREKRKNPLLQPQTLQNIQVISVTLPQHALAAPQPLTLNEQSEVIAIGDKALAPMSSSGVRALFSALTEQKALSSEGAQNAPSSVPATLSASDF
jgi:hypothetical protein